MSVYFAQRRRGGLIKIGWSGAVRERLLAPSVRAKYLLGAMPGARPAEKRLHKRFRHLRVRGEWFRPASELLDYIHKHAQKHVPDESKMPLVGIRLPTSMWDEAGAIAKQRSDRFDGCVRVTRTAVLREAIHTGLALVEAEMKEK